MSSMDYGDRMEWHTYEVMKFVRWSMRSKTVSRSVAGASDYQVQRMLCHSYGYLNAISFRPVRACERDNKRPWTIQRLLFTQGCTVHSRAWSASLIVDNFPGLPDSHTRPLVCSTPASASELDCDFHLEWIPDTLTRNTGDFWSCVKASSTGRCGIYQGESGGTIFCSSRKD